MKAVTTSTMSAIAQVVAGVCALVSATGCTQVDGGAVELSWKLRPASSSLPDKFVNCNSGQDGTSPVTRIRLDWEVVGRSSGFASWRCDDNHGVTGFDLPEGEALLSVTPECAEGPADPQTYTAPAPEQRRVILGDTVSLGAVELILQVSYCGQQPCICT
ncbi:MAG: hypothetical protein IPQ07_15385 [Myxococcales bacterium]|nr:hypothetical protein [Myxococcales bacterium]